jgi:hypothetical protein
MFGPPVPPGRRSAGRRAATVSAAAAATVAVVVVAALNWPTGEEGADQGKGRTPASSSAPRTPASGGQGTTSGSGTAPSADSAGATVKGTLLTTENVRTVLGAFREASGNPQVKEVTFYEGYALADIPTGPGAKTYDRYQYRDGVATRTGPGGAISRDSADEQPFDPTAMDWDGLSALMKRGERELNVENPNLRYVIVKRWTFNSDRPTLMYYLTNEYMVSGYLATDSDGKVVTSHPASP